MARLGERRLVLGEAPARVGCPRHLGDGDSKALAVDGLGLGRALGTVASPETRALDREAF